MAIFFRKPTATTLESPLRGFNYSFLISVVLRTAAGKRSPIQVGTLTNWSRVAAGTSHGIAVKTDGTIWNWGQNSYGAVGDGMTINRSSPVQIGTGINWVDIGAGELQSYGIRKS